jgi:predicted RNase H-like HicB family nuclease
MKRIQYLVRISRDPHSDWGASVPDLPGRVATGKTLDSADFEIRG